MVVTWRGKRLNRSDYERWKQTKSGMSTCLQLDVCTPHPRGNVNGQEEPSQQQNHQHTLLMTKYQVKTRNNDGGWYQSCSFMLRAHSEAYIPLIGNSSNSSCSSWPCQSNEMTTANVAGEHWGTHLNIDEGIRIKSVFHFEVQALLL